VIISRFSVETKTNLNTSGPNNQLIKIFRVM